MMPRRSYLALVPLLALFATGCPSPEAAEKYESFLDETEEEREDAANVKMDQGGNLVDVSGDFLLALSASLLPATPLQFYATVTFTPGADGGMLTMNLQPLSLDQGSTTTPRQPVGDSLTLGPVAVNAGGGFVLPIEEPVMVTGQANPITGADIVATLTLTGAIQSEDLFCGTVTGAVTEPIDYDLVGSTFAAVRVPSIDMLPLEVVYLCPEGGVGEESGGSGESEGSGSSG